MKTIKLSENEFKNLIKESIIQILENTKNNNLLKESYYDEDLEIEYDYFYVEWENYPELNEFLEEINYDIPNVTVDMFFNIDEGDNGDYWTAPVYGGANLIDCKIDVDGKLKKIIPSNLYDNFIKAVQSSIYNNSEEWEEKVWENYSEPYEPEYDSEDKY